MKQAKVLTDKELRRVLAVADTMRHGGRNRLAVHLSHLAGLRVGEIAHLKVGDVLTEDGAARDRLHINPSYAKGGKGRTVFINAKLAKEIEKYVRGLSTLSEPKCKRMLDPQSPLIASQKRRHFSPNSLCQLFGEIYALAGIETSSHAGRRFFITRLALSGVSAKVIMELAGHSQLTTTQRYIDVNDDMKREAVEILCS